MNLKISEGEKEKRLLRRGEMELKTKGKLGKSSGENRNSQYDIKELLINFCTKIRKFFLHPNVMIKKGYIF
jgi:hypothetical protein